MEVKGEKPVSWVEVKKILSKKEKELGYEQRNTLEYMKKFCKLSAKSTEQMMGELMKMEKLNEKHIMNIANHMPQDLDDIRLIFSNERVSLTPEDKKKIIGVVKKFS